ncbi:selenocysteine-specific translation elongation factor [Chloroflexota bacterium]
MRVIGTAGHVDHGKSSLIEALTGTHPDRLIEEQKREMTIELGFAWLTTPGGEEVGIIDVPGHRDFIGNMLAGVGGIDAVLLVIAADEGVMPQTKEHIAILDLLQISKGIIVLSKIDLVEDPEWLDLIENDIRKSLIETSLANSPIIRVSSRSNAGLSKLISTLEGILLECPDRVDSGRPRLPIDRVFSIAGFGTVVTGTLLDGSFITGDEIEVFPQKKKGRIRGLQSHKKKEERAHPGTRTAINLSGIDTDDIQRGDTVVLRGQYKSTRLVDLSIKLLPEISTPINHGTEVKLFLGTSEIMAKVRLLGTESLGPGQEGWVQLDLTKPILAVRGDRIIIRRPSPGETIGGGIVVDPFPKGRHKRFSNRTIQKLETLHKGLPTDILYHSSLIIGPGSVKEIIQKSDLNQKEAMAAYIDLSNSGLLVPLGSIAEKELQKRIIISKDQLESIKQQIEIMIDNFHMNNPLKPGISREELKSKLNLETPVYNSIIRLMTEDKTLIERGSLLRRFDFMIQFSPEMESKRNELMDRFTENPHSPPSVKECLGVVGEDIFQAMIELGELIKVSSEVVFERNVYDSLLDQTKSFIQKEGKISVSQARDHFNTSRKYILALFEFFDSEGITKRIEDYRQLR